LRVAQFDLAILLPNSFKSALVCKMAGIPHVAGYDRDGRGFLLKDKLLPGVKENGKFIPSPIVKYYMGLAHYLGSHEREMKLELFVTDAERREADKVLARCGVEPGERPASRSQPPRIILNPGAQYGAAKCWLPADETCSHRSAAGGADAGIAQGDRPPVRSDGDQRHRSTAHCRRI
jgi:heptosyltransferase-2